MPREAEPSVTPLRASERAQAEMTLALAFEADPMTGFVCWRDTTPVRKLRWIFRTELRYVCTHGVVETMDRGKAVAVWMPPGKAAGAAWALLRSGAMGAPFALGWRSAWRVVRLLRGMAALHGRLNQRAHWYLLALGVHPDCQGKGRGAALVRHGLRRAGLEGLPCYLETTRHANLAFYERHGFRLAGEHLMSGGELSLWGMLAEAGAS